MDRSVDTDHFADHHGFGRIALRERVGAAAVTFGACMPQISLEELEVDLGLSYSRPSSLYCPEASSSWLATPMLSDREKCQAEAQEIRLRTGAVGINCRRAEG
jgi:hypothetical protein